MTDELLCIEGIGMDLIYTPDWRKVQVSLQLTHNNNRITLPTGIVTDLVIKTPYYLSAESIVQESLIHLTSLAGPLKNMRTLVDISTPRRPISTLRTISTQM